MGHHVLLTPLLRMTPLPANLPEAAYAAILITSTNAIRAIAVHSALPTLLRLPVLAVGDRTADSARAAGFADVVSAGGEASDLASLAAARFGRARRRLLYLAGEERGFDFADALTPCSITVETVVVYAMRAERELPRGLADALQRESVDGVLHYSQRSVTIYLQCADNSQLREAALMPPHFCLSEQVAAPIVAAGAARVHIAAHPDEAALFRLLDAG
jgi:uroporphyrinogen-III synthase